MYISTTFVGVSRWPCVGMYMPTVDMPTVNWYATVCPLFEKVAPLQTDKKNRPPFLAHSHQSDSPLSRSVRPGAKSAPLWHWHSSRPRSQRIARKQNMTSSMSSSFMPGLMQHHDLTISSLIDYASQVFEWCMVFDVSNTISMCQSRTWSFDFFVPWHDLWSAF